jgi:hypothetical protein
VRFVAPSMGRFFGSMGGTCTGTDGACTGRVSYDGVLRFYRGGRVCVCYTGRIERRRGRCSTNNIITIACNAAHICIIYSTSGLFYYSTSPCACDYSSSKWGICQNVLVPNADGQSVSSR